MRTATNAWRCLSVNSSAMTHRRASNNVRCMACCSGPTEGSASILGTKSASGKPVISSSDTSRQRWRRSSVKATRTAILCAQVVKRLSPRKESNPARILRARLGQNPPGSPRQRQSIWTVHSPGRVPTAHAGRPGLCRAGDQADSGPLSIARCCVRSKTFLLPGTGARARVVIYCLEIIDRMRRLAVIRNRNYTLTIATVNPSRHHQQPQVLS
jgi:hypothetical protein